MLQPNFLNVMGSGLLTVLRMSAICRVTFSMCTEDLYAVANASMAWVVVIFFPPRPSSMS
jgi:hypothetical protein